jgi:hypothetical protein
MNAVVRSESRVPGISLDHQRLEKEKGEDAGVHRQKVEGSMIAWKSSRARSFASSSGDGLLVLISCEMDGRSNSAETVCLMTLP